jgi:hypothetical protein
VQRGGFAEQELSGGIIANELSPIAEAQTGASRAELNSWDWRIAPECPFRWPAHGLVDLQGQNGVITQGVNFCDKLEDASREACHPGGLRFWMTA